MDESVTDKAQAWDDLINAAAGLGAALARLENAIDNYKEVTHEH